MHFALVHGAYQGAWCWDPLRKELERDGHSTSAVDLPCEDPNAGAERYADLVVKAVPKGPAGVVLVGHSLGGLTIPVAASMTPAVMTVYLCALVPVPGFSFDGQQANIGTGFRASEPAIGHADGSASWPEAGAIGKLSPRERFHWLVSPKSTIVQTSPVHTGQCSDIRAAVEHLMNRMIRR